MKKYKSFRDPITQEWLQYVSEGEDWGTSSTPCLLMESASIENWDEELFGSLPKRPYELVEVILMTQEEYDNKEKTNHIYKPKWLTEEVQKEALYIFKNPDKKKYAHGQGNSKSASIKYLLGIAEHNNDKSFGLKKCLEFLEEHK